MGVEQASPRVLVADDDAVSREFLVAVLRQLGYEAVAAADGSQSLRIASERDFELLLLDCRMPDLGGAELLAELRKRGVQTAAIASSAEIDPDSVKRLRAAGFVDVIGKPTPLAELQRRLRSHLAIDFAPSTPDILDDCSALKAGGNNDIVRSLRGLFARELEALLTNPAELQGNADVDAMRQRLHRLRASCGFCGATALTEAISEFERSTHGHEQITPQALQRLVAACEQTLAALWSQS